MTINPGRQLNNFKNFDNSPLNNFKWEDMKKWKKKHTISRPSRRRRPV